LVKEYKTDEFIDNLCTLSRRFRFEKDCFSYRAYQDSERENTYSLVGEWKTRQAMEKHFKTREFELLIGAARVLGEKFSMNIAEVSKTGGIELAREQFELQ
jgi:quinol monooxygenase YgiN